MTVKGASEELTPLISIIVVSYNTCSLVLECLASVYRETTVRFELIVVDNASSDGSADAIATHFPDVTLLAEKHNHGFAGAHRIAVRRSTGRYLLLLNPDTVVLDGAIDRLVEFAQRKTEAGIWGGRTYYGDGSLNPTSCWRRIRDRRRG